ncbi:hypothetical protein TNCV_1778661 [Trichonephila clavipes]|nr:hypothetical protein TNCV_1778661 [Trichonephila clavipes]
MTAKCGRKAVQRLKENSSESRKLITRLCDLIIPSDPEDMALASTMLPYCSNPDHSFVNTSRIVLKRSSESQLGMLVRATSPSAINLTACLIEL